MVQTRLVFAKTVTYKAEKLSVCPSFCIFMVKWISTVDARINVKLDRNEAPVLGEHQVLTPTVRRLRRFECYGVDDSCQNFTYIPAKPKPRHN